MVKAILLIEDGARTVMPHTLQQNCRTLHRCQTESEAARVLDTVDAVVIHTPLIRLTHWQNIITSKRRLPVLWLCTEERQPSEIDWGYTLDGVLFPSMTSTEISFGLKWGLKSHYQRKRWTEEREQLLLRLEERKWIDQAKSVLCEIKGISEAEAYDFLRKQAMNERKRVGDIAASIVKVYQLIHG
jgi:response regulator NasT